MNKINFSYASEVEHNFTQRLIIKTIEQLTGKKKLEKIYQTFSNSNIEPRLFWKGILEAMEIEIIIRSKNNIEIPVKGPLLMIANHPFGIIDGLILCSIAAKVRPDFRIMTHETLRFLPELDKYIIPIDFTEDNKNSIKNNLASTKKAKDHLLRDGLLIMFPSGTVSVAKNLRSAAKEDEWKLFSAKLIHQTKTNIQPIYFDGKNGLLFHLFASKLKNQTLKYSTYIHETKKMIGKKITLFLGETIKYEEVSHITDRSHLTKYLKDITYNLKNEIK